MQKNEAGYPILLSPKDADEHGLLYKKMLVGKFMGAVYGS